MKKNTKLILMLTVAVLLLTLGVGSTIAYLIDTTNPVENTFTEAHVASTVVETFDGNTKSDVKIKNTGNTDAIIRAAIVVTWKDLSGNTMAQKPVGASFEEFTSETVADYIYELDLANGWSKGADGFYYWNETVKPGDSTGVLIKNLMLTEGAAYTDRTLCVEVIGSAIQSNKTWGAQP